MNDWILFYRNGQTFVDVVLMYKDDTRWPYKTSAITPHHGEVSATAIIETRKIPTAQE